jgi:hypothetical protein
MTLTDLDRIAAELGHVQAGYAARLVAAIRSKVEDARAHAGKALTARLKDAPDGRPTVRIAAQSASYRAAVRRLDELLTYLTGPSRVSLDGLLRDAREALYRRAYDLHRDLVPEELRTANAEPTQARIREARGHPLHGLDLRIEMAAPMERAKVGLKAALHRAGAADTPPEMADDLLDAWGQRTTAALMQAAIRALGDAAVWADGEVRRDLVRPEFQEDG